MKVLFAVNNENISESIIKKYQQDYKEIISAKNVYYFNAIIKELQKDKAYDRIIISEDLEPFSNNNYDAIDRFIFEKMDNISDEATNQSGNDIPIILICADRREKSDALLVKLFGIGVYNALLGKDRSITNVCELLNRPRGKKEAKIYYHIDSEDVDYKVENEGDVSEVEIQNILNHYKRLGKNEEKYVESFDHIASQYTDNQLRLIAKFLPLNVKAVLEANSPTYQEIISFGGSNRPKQERKYNNENQRTLKETKAEKKQQNNIDFPNVDMNLDFIEKNLSQNRVSERVIIPSGVNVANVNKISNPNSEKTNSSIINNTTPNTFSNINNITQQMNSKVEENLVNTEPDTLTTQPKRRGRPKKVNPNENESTTFTTEESSKRGRGRPKKTQEEEIPKINENDSITQSESSPINLFELDYENPEEKPQGNSTTTYSDITLPGLDYETEQHSSSNNFEVNTPTFGGRENIMQNNPINENSKFETFSTQAVQNTGKYNLSNTDLSGLLTRDKKIVAFVGTSKNGTSFLVNNIAELISKKGIKTALLDLTQNRNAYYIYTQNEESLRAKAYGAIANLRKGNPEGISVNKNLTVYTTLPGENQDINDYANILETLIKNYSLILLDCDFETNYGYFKEAQEIYLVQSLDVLTIQPLTAFLRDLKAKNVLNPEKIRIALNKVVKVRSLSEKTIIGGMAYYNDPAMSFMTELFNKDMVSYCSIPFEEQAYARYLEGLVNCKISLNGYSKNFMEALSKLASMVYPLIGSGNTYTQSGYNNYGNTSNNFSSSMNNTLNRMKNNY